MLFVRTMLFIASIFEEYYAYRSILLRLRRFFGPCQRGQVGAAHQVSLTPTQALLHTVASQAYLLKGNSLVECGVL